MFLSTFCNKCYDAFVSKIFIKNISFEICVHSFIMKL